MWTHFFLQFIEQKTLNGLAKVLWNGGFLKKQTIPLTHDTTTLLWLFAYFFFFRNKICVTHSHFLKNKSACWEFAVSNKIDSVLIFVSLSLPPVKSVFLFLLPRLNVRPNFITYIVLFSLWWFLLNKQIKYSVCSNGELEWNKRSALRIKSANTERASTFWKWLITL